MNIFSFSGLIIDWGCNMIRLTKLNNEEFVVNCNQIGCIELIPEAKIIMMNKDFYIVKEGIQEIIDKVIEYNAKIYNMHKKIVVVNSAEEMDF